VPSPNRTAIRLFSFSRSGGGSRVVVAGLRARGERSRVTSPTFAGRFLFFLFEDLRRNDFLVGRSRAERRSALQFSDRKFPGFVDSIALDGRSVYYTNGRGIYRATDPGARFRTRD
jgi:hypothetical protein